MWIEDFHADKDSQEMHMIDRYLLSRYLCEETHIHTHSLIDRYLFEKICGRFCFAVVQRFDFVMCSPHWDISTEVADKLVSVESVPVEPHPNPQSKSPKPENLNN